MNNSQKPENRIWRTVENQVRRSQLITPFGIGALTDIRNQSVIVTDETERGDKTAELHTFHDIRLQQAMHTPGFVEPPADDDFVDVKTFPGWYTSSDSQELKPIWEWEQELMRRSNRQTDQEKFKKTPFHYHKSKAGKSYPVDLIPVRIICACPAGHIQDFPWFEWAHKGKKVDNRSEHKLTLNNIGGTGTIGDLLVSCSCGKRRTLRGIFEKNSLFQKLGMHCKGEFGWKAHENNEPCLLSPEPIMRNSNSLYFPIIQKSVNIPLKQLIPMNKIYDKSGKSYQKLEKYLLNSDQPFSDAINDPEPTMRIHDIAEDIYDDRDLTEENILAIKETIKKELADRDDKLEQTQTDYRRDEFGVLTGIKDFDSQNGRLDLSFPEIQVSGSLQTLVDYFDEITLVNKLEVVSALRGYSRIRPYESDKMLAQEITERAEHGENHSNNPIEVSLRREDGKYPGLRSSGEGIFISFNAEKVNLWRSKIEGKNFEKRILDRQSNGQVQEFMKPLITPTYYMLHTFSHILLRELSFSCGYSASALSERLYYSDDEEKGKMCGVLIYTSSSDADGTLGGLVAQGFPSNLFLLIKSAIEKARWCSYDPTCIDNPGQGRNSMNLAACHACSLVSETSCEQMNLLLDRGMLVGTLEDPELGFFNRVIND